MVHVSQPLTAPSSRTHATHMSRAGTCRGVLAKQGYCSNSTSSSSGNSSTAACQKFPVVIGEVGSNFTKAADKEYFDNLVKFMKMAPPADKYATTKFNRWFWW